MLRCFFCMLFTRSSWLSVFSFPLAPLIMHSQTMNGLRRSFLCRVKKSSGIKSSESSSGSPGPEVDCNNSENVIKLLQSTQQCIPYQYAVLYCTGFIRYLHDTCAIAHEVHGRYMYARERTGFFVVVFFASCTAPVPHKLN